VLNDGSLKVQKDQDDDVNFLCMLSVTTRTIATVYSAYITNSDEGVGFRLCAMCNKIISHILPCVLLKKNVIIMVVGML